MASLFSSTSAALGLPLVARVDLEAGAGLLSFCAFLAAPFFVAAAPFVFPSSSLPDSLSSFSLSSDDSSYSASSSSSDPRALRAERLFLGLVDFLNFLTSSSSLKVYSSERRIQKVRNNNRNKRYKFQLFVRLTASLSCSSVVHQHCCSSAAIARSF
jgi:hypothetical protein